MFSFNARATYYYFPPQLANLFGAMLAQIIFLKRKAIESSAIIQINFRSVVSYVTRVVTSLFGEIFGDGLFFINSYNRPKIVQLTLSNFHVTELYIHPRGCHALRR